MTSDFPRALRSTARALAIYREGGFARTPRPCCTTSGCSRCAAATTSGRVSRSPKRCRSPTRPAQRWTPWRFARTWHAVYAAMGKLQPALSTLRRAERSRSVSRARPNASCGLALARADLAVELNDLPEAERQYERAAALFRKAAMSPVKSAARQGQGLLLLLREDNAGAARVFAQAARSEASPATGDPPRLTRLLLGYALAEKGDTAHGRRTLIAAARELATLGDVVGEATASSALGDLDSRAVPRWARRPTIVAASIGSGTCRRRKSGGSCMPDSAHAMRSRGALADAAREMRTAISEIERMSASLRVEERRSAFLADKWDVYARLALTERARGRDGDAFAASERMRARQMLDLLARGRIAPAVGARDTTTAREQDLRQRISDLTRELERGAAAVVRCVGRAIDARVNEPGTRSARRRSEGVLGAARRDAREQSLATLDLVSGETASWREVASRLAPDEALLEYLTTDSASIVFVVTRDTVDAIELDVSRRLSGS